MCEGVFFPSRGRIRSCETLFLVVTLFRIHKQTGVKHAFVFDAYCISGCFMASGSQYTSLLNTLGKVPAPFRREAAGAPFQIRLHLKKGMQYYLEEDALSLSLGASVFRIHKPCLSWWVEMPDAEEN